MNDKDLLAIFRCQVKITNLINQGIGDVTLEVQSLQETINSILSDNNLSSNDLDQVIKTANALITKSYTAG